MANFDSEFFGLVFPGLQATQKIHAQNSRPELSSILSNFTFLNPKFIHGDFLLTGETNTFNFLKEECTNFGVQSKSAPSQGYEPKAQNIAASLATARSNNCWAQLGSLDKNDMRELQLTDFGRAQTPRNTLLALIYIFAPLPQWRMRPRLAIL